MKRVFQHQDLQMPVSNQRHTSNLPPLKVVARVSETQLQVGENLNSITVRVNTRIN